MNISIRIKTLFVFLICAASLQAQQQSKDSIYEPKIDGTVRAKYEYQPQMSAGRFEVRNARFSLSGKVSPQVSYRAEIDLSDEGNLRMLDAYASYKASQPLTFSIGQMRVPFTIDAHRSPHLQYFANRSFIAKQVGDVRDVGATFCYRMNVPFPIILEGGFFNGSGLTNQKNYWTKKLNYSAKLQLACLPHTHVVLSTQAICPDSVNVNMYDIGVNYRRGRWMLEGEFLYKMYAYNAYKAVKAYDFFINYDIPLHNCFRKISVLGRYDSMTDHSDGKNYNGVLVTTDVARKRLTGGLTLSLASPFVADIRLNYEKYFYRDSDIPKISERDKFVVELMVRF